MSVIEKNGVKIVTIKLQIVVHANEFKNVTDDNGSILTTDIWNVVIDDADKKSGVRLSINSNIWSLESYNNNDVIINLEASKSEFVQLGEKKFKLKFSCNVPSGGGVINITNSNGNYMTTDWNIKFGKNKESVSDLRIFILPESPYWVIQNFGIKDQVVNIVASKPTKNPIVVPKFETQITCTVNPGATDNVCFNGITLANNLNVSLIGNYDNITLGLLSDVLWILSNSGSETQTVSLCISA